MTKKQKVVFTVVAVVIVLGIILSYVENACVHGIESKSSPGWIFVRIGRQEEGLEIEIEDTGSGMTEAKLAKLQNNMRNASIEMLKGGGRVGIINACVRLKMVTENRAEFCVEGNSRQEMGYSAVG